MVAEAWTDEELALLRREYPRRGGLARLAKALPWRTRSAIRQRARSLGLRSPRSAGRWSVREDKVLRLEWGEVRARTLREKLPGRSWRCIVRRAEILGLGSPARGRMSLKQAGRLCGYDEKTFARILREEGVHIEHHPGGDRAQKRRHPRFLVDIDEAREAVVRYIAREARHESIIAAAHRCNVHPETLRSRLRAAVEGERAVARALRWEMQRAEVRTLRRRRS